jgi:MiaB/RimO family radical SAM methylthiotransferase
MIEERMVKQISRKSKIGIMNASKNCEPSGFLFNKAVMFLRQNGYKIIFDQPAICDIILINTCCVVKERMDAAEILIEKSLRETLVKKVIVFGCFAYFAKKMGTDKRIVTIGPKEMGKFDQLFARKIPIEHIITGLLDHRLFNLDQIKISVQDYFVLISQGCAHHCSYCNIKRAKGGIVSRGTTDIINDIQRGLREGRKEFVLAGDDCGSYGVDLGTDLAGLIKEIIYKNPEARLKISSIFPGDLIRLFPALQESIATGKIVYMSVPLQSGSKRILGLMNRNYDINHIKMIIREIKDMAPSLWLCTHVIVNFPTETMEDFLRSLRVSTLFDECIFVNYSDNPLTPASNIFPKIERVDQQKRLRIVKELAKRKKYGRVDEGMDENGHE